MNPPGDNYVDKHRYFNHFKTPEEATAYIIDYIHFYNHELIHSGLPNASGMRTNGSLEWVSIILGYGQKSSADAIGLLASHSLELGLKSFLIGKGWEEKDLRNKVGHNLEKAWTEAANLGLQVGSEPPYWVNVLALGHGFPYLFRYPQENTGVAIPTPDALRAELKRVIEVFQNAM